MKKYSWLSLLLANLIGLNTIYAQITTPASAPTDERPGIHAFTNATIYVDYKTHLDSATLLVKDGKIVFAGLNVSIPADAVLHECTGKTIYPSFIDLYAGDYGLPAPKPGTSGGGRQQAANTDDNKKGAAFSWNEALTPEYNTVDYFNNDAKAADTYRKAGFGTVLTHHPDGISRGTGALVLLGSDPEQEMILIDKASHHLSFRKGSSKTRYPTSLMGVIALLRQTYLDGQWYQAEGYKQEKNLSLDAWNEVQSLPQIFEAGDKLDVLRIARLGNEFGKKYIVKSAGDEYQRMREIVKTGYSFIVPLDFPEGYDVRDPFDALDVQLKDLKHWELAPANPARLQESGISFALTSSDLKDKSKFLTNLRKAVEYGLSEEMALKALTYNPASFVNAYDKVGSLETGKVANFIIADGDIFDSGTKIQENWANGKAFETSPDKSMPHEKMGTYDLKFGDQSYTLNISGKAESPEAQIITADSSKVKVNFTYASNQFVTLSFQPDSTNKALVALSGIAGTREWKGQGTLQNGDWINWQAVLTKAASPEKPKKQDPKETPELGEVVYPFTAFGTTEMPQKQSFLIQNVTVWTSEKAGILKQADVLLSNGKIERIAKKLPVHDDAIVIDGTGKHLTAGIIDEHSHIAGSRGINEGSQESSAEVRIGDIIDSEDMDIYRQLAGGVTTSHILHGSANPIGGQTQLIKLRWGAAPEDLKFANWPGFIKFALGENVKRGNSPSSDRFPQTRMGVEETYVDYFTRAQEYGKLKKSGKPFRKDLELEALLEIMESKRFITCHSYVQSEITMMMRVAEQFGFRLNTFTHILEGYKVADKMAKHGAGASTFSDWWAYKFEVYEAIPQNARIMMDQGVTVAINSDDAEMARRLNQEAAKSVMYGGMSEEDAWKMVTINPAKLLHVDDRVGSIKSGKDADVVLWSDNPLSIYAKAEKTWVDGALYFDREEDAKRQEAVKNERTRLIQKLQSEKKGGAGGERPRRPKQHYHCDSFEDEG